MSSAYPDSSLINRLKREINDFYSLKENQVSLGMLSCFWRLTLLEWTRPEKASLFHSCLYNNFESAVCRILQ